MNARLLGPYVCRPLTEDVSRMEAELKRGARVRFSGGTRVHQPFAGFPWIRTNCGLDGELGRNVETTDEPTDCRRCLGP